MADIGEELYSRVRKEFYRIINEEDKEVGQILAKIRAGSDDFELAHKYAEKLGEALEKAIFKEISPGDLPDGRFYYDIADKVIGNPLRANGISINEICSEIHGNANTKAGVNIKAIIPESREETIKAVVAEISNLEEYTPEALRQILDIQTWSLQDVDEFQRVNSKFLLKSGMSVEIIRTYEGPHFDPHRGKHGSMQDCKYCKDRAYAGPYAGLYDLGLESEIWKRHPGCRCVIVTKREKTYQSAWTRTEGESVRDIYMQEQKRLKQVDSMSMKEKYEEINRKRRARYNETHPKITDQGHHNSRARRK